MNLRLLVRVIEDLVTVHFEDMIEPGEQLDLNLDYEGNILQYRDEGYVEHSFIRKESGVSSKRSGLVSINWGTSINHCSRA